MTQEFVTLPREVVEQALAAMSLALSDVDWRKDSPTQPVIYKAYNATRAALEQPQNHVPDAGNMVPTGWRLVPVEPTDDMLYDIQEFSHILPPRGKRIWAHMLAAAPQPPTTEQSSAVEHQQVEQEPVAWLIIEVMGPRTKVDVELEDQLQKLPSGIYKLYTNPQPRREPLTDKQRRQIWRDSPFRGSGGQIDWFIEGTKAAERAHNIK